MDGDDCIFRPHSPVRGAHDFSPVCPPGLAPVWVRRDDGLQLGTSKPTALVRGGYVREWTGRAAVQVLARRPGDLS